MPRNKTVTLWTVQPIAVYRALQTSEVLFVDPEMSRERTEYNEQYVWMRDQMRSRLSDYGSHFPWWAWSRPQPSLRWLSKCEPSAQELVVLELAKPRSSVLLSAFSAWEMILGNGYVAFTDEEYERWESCLQEYGSCQSGWPLPEPWFSATVQSWVRIFDIPGLRRGGAWYVGRIQATFEELRLSEVVSVTPFVTV